jgi:lipopolysaccharide transport system ATP-binding protein
MSDIALRVESLGKRYRIGKFERYQTLRDTLTDTVAAPFRWLRNGNSANGNGALEHIWALRDVSFEIPRGEVVGIIGRNGAGKSTLLKVLSRITEPTEGQAEIRGRVGSLLEVGTGFHAELTGRENVFLNGAILGMRKAEIAKKFDEIVAFAEIEKFLDTPVKHYSSGMYMRLAFAVAAHLDPEILIVDEVLAVGDAQFQKKCLGKIKDVAGAGRTVVFVSHNMSAVLSLCDRVILLEAGRNQTPGDPETMVSKYLQSAAQRCEAYWPDPLSSPGDETIRLCAARILNARGEVTDIVDMRAGFDLEIAYELRQPVPGLQIGLVIVSGEGIPVLTSGDADMAGKELVRRSGYYSARCRMPGSFLSPGPYFVNLGAHIPNVHSCFYVESALSFTVVRTQVVGGTSDERRKGVVCPILPWSTNSISCSTPACECREA